MKDVSLWSELGTGDSAEVIAAIRPMLNRVRNGDWRLLVIGATSPHDRDQAATFAARLLDLADALEARR